MVTSEVELLKVEISANILYHKQKWSKYSFQTEWKLKLERKTHRRKLKNFGSLCRNWIGFTIIAKCIIYGRRS